MKVVVAPDKFAGTLSAAAAGRAMADGWSAERPDDELALVPMADGGEGSIDAIVEAVPGAERVEAEVADARGRPVMACWLRLPDGRAFVESAQACGLSGLTDSDRDPLQATSYGVGQLMEHALRGGAGEIVVGLGGSATVDGGAGMAIALGHRLLRGDGNGIKVGAENLTHLARVAATQAPPVPIVAAVDVANPMLGPNGAAAIFAPQKGAAMQDLPALEQALSTLADVAERDLPGGPWRDLEGAGAAGGLGFGLAAFAGATLVGGAETIAGLVSLDDAMAGADVVITGEGSLDAQTGRMKTPGYVAGRAKEAGAVALAIAGRVAPGAERAFDLALDLGPEGPRHAVELVQQRTRELARRWGDEPCGSREPGHAR